MRRLSYVPILVISIISLLLDWYVFQGVRSLSTTLNEEGRSLVNSIFRYPNWAGLATYNNRHLYVNRGFGFLGFAGRVGIWPEITVIESRKKNFTKRRYNNFS